MSLDTTSAADSYAEIDGLITVGEPGILPDSSGVLWEVTIQGERVGDVNLETISGQLFFDLDPDSPIATQLTSNPTACGAVGNHAKRMALGKPLNGCSDGQCFAHLSRVDGLVKELMPHLTSPAITLLSSILNACGRLFANRSR